FDGLKIMDAGEKYTKEQEQYPVISLTLKSAKQPTWELAYTLLKREICAEFDRHKYILDDERKSNRMERYQRIMLAQGDLDDYVDALKYLSQCLCEYHQKKVIILIDEYDVPLENAYYTGFYDEMIGFIRSLFESALKTNPYLECAVITGCLRISKESIFSGLNNLDVISILNENYAEHFGFVEEEVRAMLAFYGRENKMDTMREWYDGYRFGTTEVYNPWSVINYVKNLAVNENAFPTPAWSNTSSNSIVKDLIYHASGEVKEEIEGLVNGRTIEKKIHEDITYGDIHESEDNLWNFLLFTGYLKAMSIRQEGVNRYVTMGIPNLEVQSIYENQIINWFRDEIKVQDLSVMYAAMMEGKPDIFEKEIGRQLKKTISYMDNHESFYHGFLLGILANIDEFRVKSNREAGNGRLDICVRNDDLEMTPAILELKVAKKFKELDEEAESALLQITEKGYDAPLEEDGFTEVIHYGISFFRKQVRVRMEREELE
ncbi:MAG TPA: AAA family ATPase, partial [Lachnospiraceae bacterium]|nr:AAA family ATPase [Lachnospiraceae bacterium]